MTTLTQQPTIAGRARWMKPADVARWLRETGAPGRRTITAITELRRARRAASARAPQPDLQARLNSRLLARYVPEVARRGGETVIHGNGQEFGLDVADRADGLVLLHASGWRHYSSRAGSWGASLSYLCGGGDNGDWAARVPGTCTTVRAALAALEPAALRGRDWLRQGDVYLVRMERASATTADGSVRRSHHWDSATRTLTHHPDDGAAHAPLTAPADWPGVKVVEQHRFDTRRGWTAD